MNSDIGFLLAAYFFTLLLGLAIGSFLNVLIYRVPRGLSIVWPPSHCPVCGHRLAWKDNIPLLSYLLLRGKCRYCGARISPRYPLIEATNALLYLGLAWRFGFQRLLVFYWALASLILALSVIDLEHHRLPDPLTLALGIIGFLYQLSRHQWMYGLLGGILGLLLGGLIYLLATWVYGPNAFGLGDVKYLAAIGVWGGPFAVPIILFLASLFGTLGGLIIAWRRRTLRVGIPFGPFLSGAFLLTILLPQGIM